ncbi:MAG: phosphatidate cytidylyltransferase [Oscillospiraceae bacterium]|nr:phosphatidate cytidylyltransferase [Oscillospiraceae bacterium]
MPREIAVSAELNSKKGGIHIKTRIITGLLGAALAITALVFIMSPIFGILVCLFAALAAYEICHLVKIKSKPLIALSVIAAAAVPAIGEYDLLEKLRVPGFAAILLFLFVLSFLMLQRFDEISFDNLVYAIIAGIAVPSAMTCLIGVRDLTKEIAGDGFVPNLAAYYLCFTLFCCWLADTFAYFVGVRLGKRKLSPRASPKKSVEGAIGSVILTTAANVGLAVLFNAFFIGDLRINILASALVGVPLILISILGDLTASSLKRYYGQKDFGKLFPGHGGVMDRFDSLLFVAPSIYFFMTICNAWNIPLFTAV